MIIHIAPITNGGSVKCRQLLLVTTIFSLVTISKVPTARLFCRQAVFHSLLSVVILVRIFPRRSFALRATAVATATAAAVTTAATVTAAATLAQMIREHEGLAG